MPVKRIIGLAAGSFVALVIFRSLQAGSLTFQVSPTDVAFLAVANIGANFAIEALF